MQKTNVTKPKRTKTNDIKLIFFMNLENSDLDILSKI